MRYCFCRERSAPAEQEKTHGFTRRFSSCVLRPDYGTGRHGRRFECGSCRSAEGRHPAVAKSIAGDTARAQEAQSQERQRAFGISSTYNRFKNRGIQFGNTTLGGN